MSLYEVDWKQHLEEGSLLTPDLEFRVVEAGSTDWREGNVYRGHKLLLGGVSEVFRAQFYGSLKQEKEVVYMKDTSMVAAGAFFDFIYMKPKEFTIDHLSIDDLFLLLILADKYRLIPLCDKVKDVIKRVRLSQENIMEVGSVAEKYSAIFVEVSSELQQRCASFLAATLVDFANFRTFLYNDGVDDLDLDLFKKLVIMAKEEDMIKKCIWNPYGHTTAVRKSTDYRGNWYCGACTRYFS